MSTPPSLERQSKIEKLQLLEAKRKLQEGLPHLYGYPWYRWAKEFFDSTEKINVLVSGNQLSKSSTQIRKCIDWATNTSKWPNLWRHKPRQFWYLYPSIKQVKIEFETKWSQFLPANEYRTHPVYGWKAEFKNGELVAIKFNSGVNVYFKVYSQSAAVLQSATVDAMFCFTGDTPVLTSSGWKRIDEIKVGERVLTKEGEWQPVVKTYSHKAPVIRRYFSDGRHIDATPDHKFWTKNRGWVEFKDLISSDSLETTTRWQSRHTRELLTTHTRKNQTEGFGIFNAAFQRMAEGFYTALFGWTLAETSPRGTSSTTRMRTHSTMSYQTWSASLRQSTRGDTKKKSGLKVFLGSCKRELALGAGRILTPQAPKKLRVSTAPSVVGDLAQGMIETAWFAIKNFVNVVMTQEDIFVLPNAVELGEKQVYCINVKERHNFYVCGIIAKNCDEEVPQDLYPELMARLTASDGFFNCVFTATLGQEFWRRVIEPKEFEEELLPNAAKWQVSMYDCMVYEDGTLTQWTDERIQSIKNRCGSEEEILKRVYGRFILSKDGKKYPQFDLKRHVTTPVPVPEDWIIYEGVDIGSGSAGSRKDGHPSAICFTAVNPTHTRGRVILGWRGDAQKTTAGDVLNKHFELKKQLRKEPYLQFYDFAAADFKTIADSQNEPFIPAEKGHEVGEQIINTLFKNDMLTIDDTDVLRLLAIELTQLDKGTPKGKAKDDFADAFRYSLTKIPWDWSVIQGDRPFAVDSVEREEKELTPTEMALKARREGFNVQETEEYGVESEIADYNEMLYYGP